MTSYIFFFFFIPFLAIVLLAVNFIFAPHNPYLEKNGAFECGFTSFLGQNRTQFSISFFIFALLFLLFDLEILLVYPYLVSSYTNESYGLVILLVFLLALTLGFVFELGKKALTIDSRQTNEITMPIVCVNLSRCFPTVSGAAKGYINSMLIRVLKYIAILILSYDYSWTRPYISVISTYLYNDSKYMNFMLDKNPHVPYIVLFFILFIAIFGICPMITLYIFNLYYMTTFYTFVLYFSMVPLFMCIFFSKYLNTNYPKLHRFLTNLFLLLMVLVPLICLIRYIWCQLTLNNPDSSNSDCDNIKRTNNPYILCINDDNNKKIRQAENIRSMRARDRARQELSKSVILRKLNKDEINEMREYENKIRMLHNEWKRLEEGKIQGDILLKEGELQTAHDHMYEYLKSLKVSYIPLNPRLEEAICNYIDTHITNKKY